MSGYAEFAHDQDIERSLQSLGDLETDRHAASGQGEHQHVIAPGVGAELRRQEPAGFNAMTKASNHA